MRDPYLYDDVNVLRMFANIKYALRLRKAEADITGISMAAVYNLKYDKFNTETLQDIHKNIFGQIYDWAGEFRTIQIVKYEDILGGDTVRYAYPKEIKKQLRDTMKEVQKLKNNNNKKDVVFKLVRIIASIWQTHPFREGNTRTVIVFAVLLAQSLGFTVNHTLFKTNSAYVRNTLVWASQGIYSKYEYLERIFFDAIIGGEEENVTENTKTKPGKYDVIGDYKVKDYKEQPHEYSED